jgi:tRNA A-37 threonylcarbamoyl transferase component Bud32
MFARGFKGIDWMVRSVFGRAPMEDPLCEAILQRFRESDECPNGWAVDWKLESAPMVRRESTVYRMSSERSGKSIAIKVVAGASGGKNDAGSLYAALCHYHARSDRERGYTVPEPYGWIPVHNAVIMEWVEGRTFNEILKTEWFFTKRRHANIRKAAGWLRWFHAQSEVKPGKPGNNKQLKNLVKIFEEGSDLDKAAAAHDPALRENLNVALDCAGSQRLGMMDHATLHGDFKATNILISQAGVVGIDFFGRIRGPVSQDICRFLSDLDFYHAWLGRSFALKPASAANDFEVFLSAYGSAAGDINKQAFLHWDHVTILSSLVHQRRKYKHQLAQKARLAVLRGIARQLSDELSKRLDLTQAKPD